MKTKICDVRNCGEKSAREVLPHPPGRDAQFFCLKHYETEVIGHFSARQTYPDEYFSDGMRRR